MPVRVDDSHIALAAASLARKKKEGELAKTPEIFHERVLRDPYGPYPKQLDILRSIDVNRRTSVVGCNGSGKDWEAGRAVLYWIWKHHPEPCMVVITGPTSRQIGEIVWREARGAFKAAWKGRLPGKMKPTDPMWEIRDDSFAIGFSTDKDYTLQGFHSPHLLVIVTEAHGMEQAHIDALRRLNPERFLMTGNAISTAGEFYDSHHAKREIYNTITIDYTDTPNFRDDLKDVPGVINQDDVDDAREDWGEESPLFQAYAHAKFDSEVEGQLISLAWLERAMQAVKDDGSDELYGGVDVAGPGEDETCAGVRDSRGQLLAMKAWSDADPTGKVADFFAPYKARLKMINCDSAGTGYYFAMALQKLGLPARGVNVGESPRNATKFDNLKAELYWSLREQFKDGEITGITDRILQGQLLTIQYELNVKGKTVIEKKKDAKKRGIRSPDRAEMLMLAYAYVSDTGDGSISMTSNWANGKRSGGRKTEHSHQLPARG